MFSLLPGTSAPIQVHAASPRGVAAIGAGYYHGLAALTDGVAAGWGYTLFAQTGTDATNSDSCGGDPCVLAPRQVAGLPAISAIAGGGDHTLALATDGTVWAWGANYSGQLGAPVGDPCTSLTGICTPVPARVTGLTGVVAIAAGYEHSLALKADGTVWAWGVNTDGTLGTASTDHCGRASSPYACSKTPIQVQGLTGVVAIAAGRRTTSVPHVRLSTAYGHSRPITSGRDAHRVRGQCRTSPPSTSTHSTATST